MKQLAIAIVAAAFIVGCESNADKPAAKASETTAVKPAAPAAEYFEVAHKGRIFVLGSKASAEKLAAGTEPGTSITRIAYGPKRETVVFEADKSNVETRLIAEFDKRHGKQ